MRGLSFAESRLTDAEMRVNLIRIYAIIAFYLVHLWNFAAPSLGSVAQELIGYDSARAVSPQRHLAVSFVCLGWLMVAFAAHIQVALGRKTPLAFWTTLGDVLFLTLVLSVSSGPRGPMVVGYFLVVMLAGLRLNLWLVRVATAEAALGYVVLLGTARWPIGIIGNLQFESVPRYHQIMILLAILIAGVIMGQIVRYAYRTSEQMVLQARSNSSDR